MLPGSGSFSSAPAPAAYHAPDNLSGFTRQVDYERGGRALHDSSRGLLFQNWRLAWDSTTREVTLSDETGFSRVMFTSIGLSQLALSFNVNMAPYIAYTEQGVTWLRWVTPSDEHVRMIIPQATQPRLAFDDKRPEYVLTSGVVMFYLKGQQLCKRYQRDGFQVEYVMANDVLGSRLGRVGMTTGMRLQVELLP